MQAPSRHHGQLAVLLAAAGIIAGCGGSDPTDPTPNPQTGAITITTATTGTDLDNSYGVLVDGTARGTIGASASVTITGLAAGSHTVGLQDINANCSATGGTSTSVTVAVGDTVAANFALACAPNVGTLVVSVLTTGVELDADGYGVALNGGTPSAVTINDTVTFADVAVGAATVTLSDLAVTCDPGAGERSVTGTATATGTVAFGETTDVAFDIACTSKDIVFLRVGTPSTPSEIFRMNADGSGEVQLTTGGAAASAFLGRPRWSPDGTQILFQNTPDNLSTEIYVMNADGSSRTLLCCSNNEFESEPTWSPDGTKIAFWRTASGLSSGIYSMNADGTGVVQLTTGLDDGPDWGPDGRIVFVRTDTTTNPFTTALYIMDADGTNVTLLQQGTRVIQPAWSPDGATIAYANTSDGAGGNVVLWTIPAAGGTATQRPGGELREHTPRWSPDGSTLIFWYWAGTNYSDPHGLCTAPAGGGTCTRISSLTQQATFHIDPDWRN